MTVTPADPTNDDAGLDRLSLGSLARLPVTVDRPAYDVPAVACGIVHLGIGAFHRAHQAFYTDGALASSGGAWGIVGASLRHPDIRDRLKPQDGLYTLIEKSGMGDRPRVIGAVRDVLFAPGDLARLLDLIAAPQTRIVGLTVTEKGYCHDPATGRLDASHPDIAHDLAHIEEPASAIGILVAGLNRRYRSGGVPTTIMSCDNLPQNGVTLRGIVFDFASRIDTGLTRWLENDVTFPCSMVDRITPATTDGLIAETSRTLGLLDAAPIQCEPFTQWVIEDNFAAGRPCWERVGVEIVENVTPFEEMKLRLLNGSHSMLAYLGYLGGYQYIWQLMREADYRDLVAGMMQEEVTPTLALARTGEYDLKMYQSKLIERFSNPALPHLCYQITMDGSQKLPQRLLDTIRANLTVGRPFRRLALGVAAWMRFVGGVDEGGRPIVVKDPLAGLLAERVRRADGSAAAAVTNLLSVRAIFGDDLPQAAPLREELTGALTALMAYGARETVRRYARADAV